jgi:spermidine/putrescine transport system substrate-binding protein
MGQTKETAMKSKSSMQSGIGRREFMTLGGLAAGAALGAFGSVPAFAAEGSISGVMPGVVLPKTAREVVERSAGIKVENVPYVSPTDTVAKLLAPGGTSRYDLMISVTEFVKGPVLGRKAGDEKVRSFDMSKVPNAADLQSVFKDQVQVRDGKTFMIPIFYGYDSPLFRTDIVPEQDAKTQSWGLLFDEKYAGKTALRDDAYQSIVVAALHLGHPDPAAMGASDLAEVKKFLIAKKKNFRTLWTQFGEAVNLMSSGEVVAMYGWMPMRAALQKNGVKVTNAWPKEGLLLWNQAAFIPKESPHAEATEKVVNAMLSPEFGVALAKESNYGPVTNKAIAAFSQDDQKKIGLDATTRGAKLYTMKWPADMNSWIEAWGAFKAA